MATDNETVADIVQEMRDIFALTGIDKNKSHLMGFFECIETAHRREVAELRAALKVAEEALVKLQTICRQTEYVYGRVICDDALATIREKGAK